MDGCPHCEATWPAWRSLKRSSDGVFKEVESKEVGPQDGVSSFPTFVVLVKGREVRRIEGARSDSKALAKELGLARKHSSRRRTHRGGRKLRRRTLRNYKAF